MKYISSLFLGFLCCFWVDLSAQVPTINLTSYATGFSAAVGIEHCGDNRLFIVEQTTGLIKIVQPGGAVNPTPFLNIGSRISIGSERGLLGLAFHPNYAQNGYFYVNYTKAGTYQTIVARYQVTSNPDSAAFNSEVVLLDIAQPYSNHNGGRIAFGPDGYLYVGMGDGGSGGDPGNRAQDPTNLLGKILRIDVDGGSPYAIPPSNPYFGQTSPRPEIWAIGMRNPWRFSFDRVTEDLWIADVGQNAWEEFNLELAGDPGGHNYGWRCYEGNVGYNTAGCQPQNTYVSPIIVYGHTSGNCSVDGGYRYRGGLEGDLYGYYVWIDLCSGIMGGITPNGSAWQNTTLGTFLSGYGSGSYRWSTFGEDSNGELFLANVSNGIVYKMTTTSCIPTAVILAQDSCYMTGPADTLRAITGTGLTYQWLLNNAPIGGATSSKYLPVVSGAYSILVSNSVPCRDTSNIVNISFYSPTFVSLAGLDSTHCPGDANDTLVGMPPGGVFSGPLVNGNQFNPSLNGSGMFSIQYTVSDGYACDYITTQTTTVGGASVSFTGLDAGYAITPGSGQTDTLTGVPTGGVFSGVGMNGNILRLDSIPGTGTYWVYYTFTDSLGCISVDSASFDITSVGRSNGMGNEFNISLFPNPANQMVSIAWPPTSAKAVFSLNDLSGKTILNWNAEGASGKSQIELSGIAHGLYLLNCDFNGLSQTFRLSVTH